MADRLAPTITSVSITGLGRSAQGPDDNLKTGTFRPNGSCESTKDWTRGATRTTPFFVWTLGWTYRSTTGRPLEDGNWPTTSRSYTSSTTGWTTVCRTGRTDAHGRTKTTGPSTIYGGDRSGRTPITYAGRDPYRCRASDGAVFIGTYGGTPGKLRGSSPAASNTRTHSCTSTSGPRTGSSPRNFFYRCNNGRHPCCNTGTGRWALIGPCGGRCGWTIWQTGSPGGGSPSRINVGPPLPALSRLVGNPYPGSMGRPCICVHPSDRFPSGHSRIRQLDLGGVFTNMNVWGVNGTLRLPHASSAYWTDNRMSSRFPHRKWLGCTYPSLGLPICGGCTSYLCFGLGLNYRFPHAPSAPNARTRG